MTLITYLTRVHFADGVLEEALWSELKAMGKRTPVLVTDAEHAAGPLFERLRSGFPTRCVPALFTDIPATPNEAAAARLAAFYREVNADLLVAFGPSAAIDLAKVARIAITHPDMPLITYSYAQGGSRRIGADLPDLFAIQSIVGFGSAVAAHAPATLTGGERALMMCRKLIPTVTICDPTVTLGASPELSASAGADAITRCIEAFLSRSYNPPADGIALDGLRRAVANIGRVLADSEDLAARREMMAATLNGALALQKGLGASHAMTNALRAVAEHPLDQGALSRILLPEVMRFNRDAVPEKATALAGVLGGADRDDIVAEVEALFAPLPLPTRLSELEISARMLRPAAQVAAHDLATDTNPRRAEADDYLALMQSVQ
ncbi:MAG: iron-containing alcohol dehydrogenase [Pseudomonadota bacterium]